MGCIPFLGCYSCRDLEEDHDGNKMSTLRVRKYVEAFCGKLCHGSIRGRSIIPIVLNVNKMGRALAAIAYEIVRHAETLGLKIQRCFAFAKDSSRKRAKTRLWWASMEAYVRSFVVDAML